MNLDTIESIIRAKGRKAHRDISAAGPIIGVESFRHGQVIWGFPPIDNESDARFAEFLVQTTEKYENGTLDLSRRHEVKS